MEKPHYLPLSIAAIDILNQIQRIDGNPTLSPAKMRLSFGKYF